MGAAYDRGLILYRQRRYAQARQEFANELAMPGPFIATMAMMSLSLSVDGKFRDGRRVGEDAVGHAPNYAFAHYALAYAIYRLAFVTMAPIRTGRFTADANVYRRKMLAEAEAVLREAMRLSPTDADFYSLLSAIKYDTDRMEESLEIANNGLAHDPRHDRCLIRRAGALLKLKRLDEAQATARDGLKQHPEHSGIHLILGQILMHQHGFTEAGDHFAQTLRTDPSNAEARQGLLETRCARRAVYRPLLGYVLWIQRHKRPMKMLAVILGVLSGVCIAAAQDHRAANWFLMAALLGVPLLTALFIMPLFFTRMLFSIFLLFDPIGRRCLSRLEKACGIMMMLVPLWLVGAWALINFNLVTGDDQSKVFAAATWLTVITFAMHYSIKKKA